MDFTIYSIGSAAYLHQIIMAVASIFNMDSYTSLIGVGLLLGILIMAFQGMASGGRDIPFAQVVTGALLFALMFGPKVNLAIEDVYSADVRSVENVPIGIAAPGSFISQIGYRIARTFETAFQPVGATSPTLLTSQEGGGGAFADSLKLLNGVRRSATSSQVLGALDAHGGGSFRKSWDNYIRECVAIKIDQGLITVEQIYAADNYMEALRFENTLFGTEIIYSGHKQQVTCPEAHTALAEWTDSGTRSDNQDLWAAFAQSLGRHHNQGYDQGPAGADLSQQITQMTNSMSALTESSVAAQNYVRTSILEPIFQESLAGRYSDLRDFSTAAMINTALQQRNIQWAAEQTVFMSIVRPMITFIEGFAYAITPFMGFIIVLGSFGIKLAVKYGQMLLWIQLWLPVLAITNFFLYMVASHDIVNTPHFTTSFYAMNHIADRMGHWIGVGGMLAAATPILTLVLLTGSAYAMTSLAQRMQGADHVNEKQLSPDAVQQGAVLNNMQMYTHDSAGGQRLHGMDGLMPTLALSSKADEAYASASTELSQAQSSFQGTATSAFQTAYSSSESTAQLHSIARSVAANDSTSDSAVRSVTSQIMRDHNIDNSHQEAVAGQVAASLSLGKALNLVGLTGTGSMSSTTNDATTVSAADVTSMARGAGLTAQSQASLTEGVVDATTGSDETRESLGITQSEANQLQTSAAELSSAAESYTETSGLVNSMTWAQSAKLNELGNHAVRQGVDQRLEGFFMNNPHGAKLNNEANTLASRYQTQYGMGEQQALAAARMKVMSDAGSYGGDHQAHREGVNTMLSVASAALGGDATMLGGNAPTLGQSANEGVSGNIQTPGQVGGNGAGILPTSIGSNYEGEGGGTDAPQTFFADAQTQVMAEHDANTTLQAQQAMSDAVNRTAPITPSLANRFFSGSGPTSFGGVTNTNDAVIADSDFNHAGLAAVARLSASTTGGGAAAFHAQSGDVDAATSDVASRVSSMGASLSPAELDAVGAGLTGGAPPSDQNLMPFHAAGQAMAVFNDPDSENYLASGDRTAITDAPYARDAIKYAQERFGYTEGQAGIWASAQLGNPDAGRALYDNSRAIMAQETADTLGYSSVDELTAQDWNYVNTEAENTLSAARLGDGDARVAGGHSQRVKQANVRQ